MSISGFKQRFTRATNITTKTFEVDTFTSQLDQTITDPITFVAKEATGFTGNTDMINVVVQGGYAYIPSSVGNAFIIMNVSDPTNPVIVSTLVDGTNLIDLSGVAVSGDYAYVTGATGTNLARITIIDISDKTTPVVVQSVHAGNSVGGSGLSTPVISGGYLYTASTIAPEEGSLLIFDISSPGAAIVMSLSDNLAGFGDMNSLVVRGNYLYLASVSKFVVVDITDKAAPSVTGSVVVTGSLGVGGFEIIGSRAYLSDNSSSPTNDLVVIDVDDPTAPVVSSFTSDFKIVDTAGTVYGVHMSFPYLYVAVHDSVLGFGVARVNMSDPLVPVLSGAIYDSTATNLDTPYSLTVHGKYLYVANTGETMDEENLSILDISGNTFASCDIGNINVGDLQVTKNMEVSGDIHALSSVTINGGLSVTGGPFSVAKSTVTQTGSLTSSVTIVGSAGVITTVSASTGTSTKQTFPVFNGIVTANSVVHVTLVNYSGTGIPVVSVNSITAEGFGIDVVNVSATAVLNDVLKIAFLVV